MNAEQVVDHRFRKKTGKLPVKMKCDVGSMPRIPEWYREVGVTGHTDCGRAGESGWSRIKWE